MDLTPLLQVVLLENCVVSPSSVVTLWVLTVDGLDGSLTRVGILQSIAVNHSVRPGPWLSMAWTLIIDCETLLHGL